MENSIELQLLAVDFKGTDFIFGDQCAIEKAVTRQLDAKEVSEYVTHVFIDGKSYVHKAYSPVDFLVDQLKAEKLDADALVRTVTLTRDHVLHF